MTLDHDHPMDTAESGGGGVPWRLIGLILIVAALAVFFVQNGERVLVEFLMFDGTWPLWAVIGVSVVFGALIDRLGGWLVGRRRRHDD